MPPSLADGAMSVVLQMDMENFKKNLVSFLREVKKNQNEKKQLESYKLFSGFSRGNYFKFYFY